eukprot:jgi/Botrbrau1/3178/Bobra.37_2s0008.1
MHRWYQTQLYCSSDVHEKKSQEVGHIPAGCTTCRDMSNLLRLLFVSRPIPEPEISGPGSRAGAGPLEGAVLMDHSSWAAYTYHGEPSPSTTSGHAVMSPLNLLITQETLPDEVLEKMHAPPKPDVPFITDADLGHADGYVFGFPTRFGNMPAQMKAFIDATGGLWQKGALVGKPFSMFTSTASLGGGQETTIYACKSPANAPAIDIRA